MKSSFKKIIIASAATMCLGVTACAKYEDALSSYIFEYEERAVSNDFVLPRKIDGLNVQWSSSNEDVIEIIRGVDEFTADVKVPDEDQEVTLTVKIGSEKKEYVVYVNALRPADFAANFSFAKNRGTVTDNFNLPTTFDYLGKTCEIEWSVEDVNSKNFLEVADVNGVKVCKVTPSSLNPAVKLQAKFKFNGNTYSKSYDFTVSVYRDALEAADYWYNNTGVTQDFVGYVQQTNDVSSSFKNATVYVVNEEGTAGFYFYRVGYTGKVADLVPGAKVKVSSVQSYAYSGLIEGSSTGTLTLVTDENGNNIVDTSKIVAYDLNDEILGGLPSTQYHTGRLVSLNGWKLTKKETWPTEYGHATIATITNGDVSVDLRLTKYLANEYSKLTDAKCTAIKADLDSFAVNSLVNVTGYLTRSTDTPEDMTKGWQLYVSTGETTATHAITAATALAANTNAAKYKAAQTAVATAINTAGLNKIVTSEKSVNLPSTSSDVTLSYEIKTPTEHVTKDSTNKLTVAPGDKEEFVNIQVNATLAGKTYISFFTVHSINKTPAEQVELEKGYFSLTSVVANKAYELLPKLYEDVALTVAAKEGYENLVTIDGNKITFLPVDEATECKIKVTFTNGNEHVDKEITVSIPVTERKGYYPIANPTVDTEYDVGVNSKALGKTYFVTGNMANTYYFGLSTKKDDGKKATLETATGGYYLKINGKYVQITLNIDKYNTTYTDAKDANTTVWTIDDQNRFVTTVSSKEVALFQNYTNEHVGCWTIEGHENSDFSPLMIFAYGEDNTQTQGRADKGLTEIAANDFNGGVKLEYNATYELPSVSEEYNDVYYSYAVKNAEDAAYLQFTGNEVKVIEATSTEKDIVVTVTAKCGQKTATKDVTVKVNLKTINYDSVAKVLDLFTKDIPDGKTAVSGFIVKEGTEIYVSDDLTKEHGVLLNEYSNADLVTGDYVRVLGDAKKGNTAIYLDEVSLIDVYDDADDTKVSYYHYATIADMIAMFGAGTATDAQKATYYVVTGVVTYVETKEAEIDKYGNCNFFLTDGNGNRIEAYKTAQLDKKLDVLKAIAVGDTITFVGKWKVYNGLVETNNGATLLLKAAGTVDTKNVADEFEAIQGSTIADQSKVNTTGIDLPKNSGTATGATVTWSVVDGSNYISVSGAKVKINTLPAEGAEAVTVKVRATITFGSVSYTKDYSFKVSAPLPADVVAASKAALVDSIRIKDTNDVTLPTDANSTITYALTDNAGGILTLTDGKIKASAVTDTLVTGKITATITYNDATDTKVIDISIREYYEYEVTDKGTNNGYATAGDVVCGDITWNAYGNLTLAPWRVGGKSITATDRIIYSKNQIAGTFSEFVVTFGESNGSIVVNSIKLEVSSSSDFSTIFDTVTVETPNCVSNSVTFEANEGKVWKNMYYRISINVTVAGSGNKYITVSKLAAY